MTLRSVLLIINFIQCCNSQNFICCDGAIRLLSSSSSNEGRVEICSSGQWKTVCDNNWSENEARVVCRQLGYATQVAVPLMRAAFGMGTGMIVEQVRCNGTEKQIAYCAIRDVHDGECNHNEDAGVRCSCRNGDLRLQGSTTLGRGRVEVCLNNVWGTICRDSWSSTDANVVCNQLGFSRFRAYSCCAQYDRGSGPVHMTKVRCRGNESSLTDCPYTTYSGYCGHGADAAVQCQTTIICRDGDVRLVNGNQPHEGRVEICFDETWGTVCSHISPYYWNHTQADIVCKQLGYMQAASSTSYFGGGSAPAKIAYVSCRGTESSLAECSYSTSQLSLSYCVRSKDIIGVQCQSDTIMNGTLRLADGLTQYEGRVEMYWDSEWKSIILCNDEWDELDAMVVCRQMKYLPTSIQIHALSYDDHHFKSQRSPVLLASVGCNGTEINITSCCSTAISNNFHCLSQTYAGVRCSQCIENSVQLVGELSQQVGSPVICLGGRWGKVCDLLNSKAAVVVCRQLGFSIEDPIIYYRFLDKFKAHAAYGPGLLPFTIQNVRCTSKETQFSQCNYGLRAISRECREWSIIRCQIARENTPGTPQALKISSSTSSTLTLTWSPPPLVSEIHGLPIDRYAINCSAGPQMQNSIIKYTDVCLATFSNLDPFTSYNCCVAAVSDRGSGKLACINTVTATTAPSGTPTRLQSTSINSTTLLLSWHAPNAEYVNGILRGYSIQIIDNSTGVQMNYTTDSTHIFLNNLWPNHPYTLRVAAYTNGRGPFSQLTNITLSLHSPTVTVTVMEEDFKTSDIQHQDHSPLMLTASFLGLASFLLLIVAAVAGIFISYKLCKQRNKKVTRLAAQVPIYEMVDMPPQLDSGINKSGDANVDQLTLKQEQAKDFFHLPHEYLTPAITKFDQSAGPGRKNQALVNEENAYQPLIPPRLTALSTNKSEYQSLTRKTLPTKFSAPSAPPAIPPKPKATSTITQGCVQHIRKK